MRGVVRDRVIEMARAISLHPNPNLHPNPDLGEGGAHQGKPLPLHGGPDRTLILEMNLGNKRKSGLALEVSGHG